MIVCPRKGHIRIDVSLIMQYLGIKEEDSHNVEKGRSSNMCMDFSDA